MNKKIDVLTIGSGLAGLTAALAAATRGKKVAVASQGMGSLAISGSCVDLLGYSNEGHRLQDPWEGMARLAPDHPYSLLGPDKVKEALSALCAALGKQGLKFKAVSDENGSPRNALMPTIMGTLKPTWLVEEHEAVEKLDHAGKILVVSVRGFRDCRPRLIIDQLRRYPGWKDREYASFILPAPFDEPRRGISALDIAHVSDRKKGGEWLLEQLKNLGKGYDVALLPPMLGARAKSPVRDEAASALGCPFVEMQSVPPGVGGLRIRDALITALDAMGVEFYENAEVTGSKLENGVCHELTLHSTGRDTVLEPGNVVIATGGIISGGVILSPGKAVEKICGLDIPVPENVDDWTEPEIFGRHLITSLGVKVNAELRPVDQGGVPVLINVFFAGRTIGGYDYAAEKSGHGVAASTGWHAGLMAAGGAADGQTQTSGAES